MSDPGDMLRLDDCVPIEKFTLILKHEYVDKDGKYLIDQPLMVSATTPWQNEMDIVPINMLIQRLTEKMKSEGFGWM